MTNPLHWDSVALGSIGRLFKGNGGTKEDEVPTGVPCVRYGDLYSKYETFITTARSFVSPEAARTYTPIRFGDVLFAGSGETIEEIGKSAVNLLEGEACCGGDVLICRPARTVDPRFLGYALDAPSSVVQKARMGRGVTVMHIYADELKRLRIAVPTLDEQAAIARFLAHADRRIRRAIRAKQKLIGLLNEQKQAVVHRAVTRGLDTNANTKRSPYPWLGDVLAEWDIVPLGRLIELTTGFPFRSEDFSRDEQDIRLLRGINVTPGALRWDSVVRWPRAAASEFTEFRLRSGDIVFGMDRPTVAAGIRVAVVTEDDVPALLLQRVARIRVLEGLDPSFALLLLGGKAFSDYLAPIFTGVSVPHVSPEQIRAFRIPLPPLREQREMASRVNEVSASIAESVAAARKQIALLQEYRTGLIAEVVTGQLDVRDAAQQLPDETDEEEPLDEDVESNNEADIEDLEAVEA